MQKIMFNDQYGLTKAVLDGKKTQTRRLALRSKEDVQVLDSLDLEPEDKSIVQHIIEKYSRFKVGETVAVAQNYSTIMDYYHSLGHISTRQVSEKELIFWNEMRRIESEGDDSAMQGDGNKMFVKAEFMPHQICITCIRLERLQDISDKDCLKEGRNHRGLSWCSILFPNRNRLLRTISLRYAQGSLCRPYRQSVRQGNMG